jgi:tellurite methyltransferase
MKSIPNDCLPYSRSPTFTQDTLPESLRRDHSTKRGTWALIHVLKGQVRYVIHSAPEETVLLGVGEVGVIEPEVMHHVEPVGLLEMFVEFYRLPQ